MVHDITTTTVGAPVILLMNVFFKNLTDGLIQVIVVVLDSFCENTKMIHKINIGETIRETKQKFSLLNTVTNQIGQVKFPLKNVGWVSLITSFCVYMDFFWDPI